MQKPKVNGANFWRFLKHKYEADNFIHALTLILLLKRVYCLSHKAVEIFNFKVILGFAVLSWLQSCTKVYNFTENWLEYFFL